MRTYLGILKYLAVKTLIFIPIFWFSYIFQFDLSYAMVFRFVSFIFCFILMRIIADKIVDTGHLTSFDDEPPVVSNYLESDYSAEMEKKGIWAYIKVQVSHTINLVFYVTEILAKNDRLKVATALLVIIGFLSGNPLFNNYTGVRDEVEDLRGGYVAGSFSPLYTNNQFRTMERKGYFDRFESYTTKAFLFKETGIMSGFYPKRYKDFDFAYVFRLTFLPFIEASIKAFLFVPLYYLICIIQYQRSDRKGR